MFAAGTWLIHTHHTPRLQYIKSNQLDVPSDDAHSAGCPRIKYEYDVVITDFTNSVMEKIDSVKILIANII